MKNLLSFWCLLCFSLCIQAQQITAIEYYFNSDPGIGNGIPITADTNIETAVDISGLPNGIHTLYVRAKDSENNWSLLQSRTFNKVGNLPSNAPLKAIEYYFNEDSGIGKANTIEPATEIETAIDISGLADGVHQLYIRAQDNNNNWSLLQHRTFIKGVADVLPEITDIEYYINDDPGLGKGESMNFTSDEFTFTEVSSNYVIDLSALKDGVHNIYVRAKDDNEHWSMLQHRTFIKLPLAEPAKITEIEVKVEGIEPYNEWTPLTNFLPDVEVCTDFAIIEMCDLPNGEYSIQARAIDNEQRTGPIFDELLEIDCRIPQIELDNGEIKDEQPLTITGKGFKSDCAVSITLNGLNTDDRQTFETTTDEAGIFSYNLTMPVSFETGFYFVQVACANQDTNPNDKRFKYVKTKNQSLINIISPSIGDELKWENICITWNDIIRGKKQYSDVLQFEKQVEYDIYYTIAGLEDWILLETYTDKVFPSKYPVNFTTCVDIEFEGEIQIKIENKKDNTLFGISEPFTIYDATPQAYQVDFLWDKSFYSSPDTNPLGVVTDGVARIVMQLTDYTELGNISKVEVNLSDPLGGATSSNMLGKVMMAKDDITKYSNEANNATETSISCNSEDCGTQNQFNFWYVAPEDFSKEDVNYYYDQASERIVLATFTLTFGENIEPVTVERNIKIVRPPLLLAHGFISNQRTWDNFSSTKKDGSEVKFIQDDRFKYKKAINLFEHEKFDRNAKVLLGIYENTEDSSVELLSSNENSLIGNISLLRSMGYACNQVNYLGHSMGGLVIRAAAEENYANFFFSDKITDEYPYSNYGQGFVNRLITIGSPHNGSFWAELLLETIDDLLTDLHEFDETCYYLAWINLRLADKARQYGIEFDFDLRQNESGANECDFSIELWDAIENLSISNGYNFSETKISTHFLAGEILLNDNFEDIDGFNYILEELETPINILEDLIASTIELVKPESLNNTIISQLLGLLFSNSGEESGALLSAYTKYISILKLAASAYEGIDFLEDTDGIVSVVSQLANIESNKNCYTIFDKTVHGDLPVLSSLGTPITQSSDAGDKAFKLLNYGLEKFTHSIPSKSDGGLINKEISFPNQKFSLASKINTKMSINPDSFEFLKPQAEDVIFVDSLLNIQVRLIDTVDLSNVKVYFQDEFLSFTNINDTLINQTVVISDQYLGRQDLIVTGIYNYGDSTVLAIETITLEVKAKDAPVDLIIEPAINYGYTGEQISPDYFAVFPTFVSELKSTNTDISVEIENEDILTFNKNNNTFTGKAEGETFAIIKYFDTADTAQFIIYQSYEEEPKDTVDTIDNIEAVQSFVPMVNLYPNPAENRINVDFNLAKSGKVSIEIVDIAGRSIKSLKLGLKEANISHTEQIALTKIQQGMYMMNLYFDNYKYATKKFIVN